MDYILKHENSALKKYIEHYSDLKKNILFEERYLLNKGFSIGEIYYLRDNKILTYLEKSYYTIKETDINDNCYLIWLFITTIHNSYITSDTALMRYWLKSPVLSISYAWKERKYYKLLKYKIKEEKVPYNGEFVMEEALINNGRLNESCKKIQIRIATPEQALIDYFFNERDIIRPEEFNVIWFDKEIWQTNVNQKKLLELAQKTNSNTTIEMANNFCFWLNNDVIDLE